MGFDVIVSTKIPAEINEIIEQLAKKNYTTKSAIVRKYLIRGLEAGGVYKKQEPNQKNRENL